MINKVNFARFMIENTPYLCGKAVPEHEPQQHIQHPPIWRIHMLLTIKLICID
jgi:hypothetical protein